MVLQVEGEQKTYRVRPFEVVELSHRPDVLGPATNDTKTTWDAGPHVMVRQGRRLGVFAVDAPMAALLRQLDTARRLGQPSAVPPELLGELIAAGVVCDPDVVAHGQKGGGAMLSTR